MDKARLLSGSTLFCELDEAELQSLAARAELRHVAARHTILQQGSKGHEMYALIRGRLRVYRCTDEGREITLSLLEAGDVFGEVAMLDGGPRSASIDTLEACELLVLKREDVMDYLDNHPKVMRQLISALCQRLRNADEMVQDTLFLPLPQRLGKCLKTLAEQNGNDVNGWIEIDLKFTQQEVANLVGASRESVNKQINTWVDQGKMLMSSGRIRIKPDAELL
ncbi:Crp/Fnr family transcriptional regulator [Chitinilyticum piscinae]|uniref:Crp/Fnr family transcriptional regulator n=1 Tax=Chitinilyticum piscinae TaxID=2866724 RepID=A0A8J7K8Z7_9NEIS|nr:Crp/Fnr family transcriptional regulator [Chitinilyticum piscinae]MBE9610438.1 Crp/Fnr family transcriptional regulator [Chitinilyticum piscinae]